MFCIDISGEKNGLGEGGGRGQEKMSHETVWVGSNPDPPPPSQPLNPTVERDIMSPPQESALHKNPFNKV